MFFALDLKMDIPVFGFSLIRKNVFANKIGEKMAFVFARRYRTINISTKGKSKYFKHSIKVIKKRY